MPMTHIPEIGAVNWYWFMEYLATQVLFSVHMDGHLVGADAIFHP